MEKMLRSVRLCMRRYEDTVLEWPQFFSMWVHSRKWKTYEGYKKCAVYGHCKAEGTYGCVDAMPEFPLPHPSAPALPKLPLPHPSSRALLELPLPHPSPRAISSTGHLLRNRKMLMLLLSVLVEIVLVVDQT